MSLFKKEVINNLDLFLSNNLDICYLCLDYLENYQLCYFLSKCSFIFDKLTFTTYIYNRYQKR